MSLLTEKFSEVKVALVGSNLKHMRDGLIEKFFAVNNANDPIKIPWMISLICLMMTVAVEFHFVGASVFHSLVIDRLMIDAIVLLPRIRSITREA